jgi:hypothetical protein
MRLPPEAWTRPRNDGTGTADELREQEHHAMDESGQPKLHVFQQDGPPRPYEWAVWLNTGVSDFDGLCIGIGATRDEAIADAVKVLEWATERLQGPPPNLSA